MKNILIVNNLKIEINGLVSQKREKNFFQKKLDFCIEKIKKNFENRRIKVKLPPFYLNSKMNRDVNIIYDKYIDKFYVNLFFIRNSEEKVIIKFLIDSISLYINNKLNSDKKNTIKEIFNLVNSNRKVFGKYINGNNLLIPNGTYHGIMIPKISLCNIHDFSVNITSIYLKNLYPNEIKDKNTANLVVKIKELLNNINI